MLWVSAHAEATLAAERHAMSPAVGGWEGRHGRVCAWRSGACRDVDLLLRRLRARQDRSAR
eukprot:5013961-Pleurochrysis_carterae.AAC.1